MSISFWSKLEVKGAWLDLFFHVEFYISFVHLFGNVK